MQRRKNNLFLQHDRAYPPKASIKRLPIKKGGLTALNGRIPPEEHRTLFGLSLKLRSARGPTDRLPQICQRAARYLGDLTANIAGRQERSRTDLLHIPDGPDRAVRPGLRKRRQHPKHSISFIPSRTAPLRSRRIGHNRPGRLSHP